MSEFQRNLEKYAELAVKVGVNIQKGQILVINTTIDAAEFVRLVVKSAYTAGADNVVVNWTDDVVSRTKYELAPDEAFTTYPVWRAKEMEDFVDQGAAFMAIVSSSPDLLKGVNPERISNFQKGSARTQ
jgi:aminopeptidase